MRYPMSDETRDALLNDLIGLVRYADNNPDRALSVLRNGVLLLAKDINDFTKVSA